MFTRALTEFVVSKSLHNLWDEEEGELDRMLFQHTVCVLQQKRVVVVAFLEERRGKHGRDRSP